MNHRLARVLVTGIMLLAAGGVAACGKAEDSGGGGGGATAGGVKTGPGVTAKEITLGELTDLSGVFGALGKPLTASVDLFWKDVNASGGVCGRQVKLVVKDHAYDVQKAVSLYRDISPDVAAINQMIGSPIAVALEPTMEKDSMLAILAAWPPSLLPAKNLAIVGATYDIEAINGIDWLMKNKGVKRGDKIGALYFEGDFGEGGLKGVKYAAEQNGLEVVEQKIKATDEDMSSAAQTFKRAGVKAVWMTTGPTQLASLAGVAKSIGLDVPIGTNGPTFAAQLLATPAAGALGANVTVFASTAPYASDNAAVQKAAQAYEKAFPKETPNGGVVYGAAEGEIMRRVLEKACEDKDLSREGIVNAFRSLSSVDTEGLVSGTLDFSQVGKPSGTAVYALDVDKGVKGGLKALGEAQEAELAQQYAQEGGS